LASDKREGFDGLQWAGRKFLLGKL
jgi:hypothetical protein